MGVIGVYFTKFEDIYRLFLGNIQDYHLKDMFEKNPEVAEDMMETFLKRAVYKFENCVKDVKDIDLINKSFRCELDLEEQNIVANLMVLSWLEWNTQNTTFMNPTLTDNDLETENISVKKSYEITKVLIVNPLKCWKLLKPILYNIRMKYA